MTVKQAIERINAERLSGNPAKEWHLLPSEVAELEHDLMSGFDGSIETGALPKVGDSYITSKGPRTYEELQSLPALTFMGVDIYRLRP